MTEERTPKIGDYWCKDLLTEDFFEAVNHAAKYARKHGVATAVQRYREIQGTTYYLDEVAVIASPTTWS